MALTHYITLQAIGEFPCQKDDGSFYTPSKKIKEGTQITLIVSNRVTENSIFSLPNNSKDLDDIITQLHDADIMIAKNQLGAGYWKVVDPSQNKIKKQK